MNRPMQIWWLHPAWLFTVLTGGAATAAYLVPDRSYGLLWNVNKFFDVNALLLCLAIIPVFWVGYLASNAKPSGVSYKQLSPDLSPKLLLRLIQISTLLCACGYSIWAGVAVGRGLTLSALLALFSAEGGAAAEVRLTYMAGVNGITTFTQFGVATGILCALYGAQHGWRKIAPYMSLIVLLALGRAIINSERAALLELVVPPLTVIVLLIAVPMAERYRNMRFALRLAPVGGAIGVVTVFATFEYFRSWVSFYAGGNQSFWEFIGYRLAGYYVTAMNNGAFLLERLSEPVRAPIFTLNFAYRLPVVKDVLRSIAPSDFDYGDYPQILLRGANPEFDNPDGLLLPFVEFGDTGGLLYWLMCGAVFGLLFRLFRQRSSWGLCLYPLVCHHLLEVPRGLYGSDARAFPAILFLAASALLLHYQQLRDTNRNKFRLRLVAAEPALEKGLA